MKKKICLLLLLALALTGCGREEQPHEMEIPVLTEAPTTQAPVTEATVPAAETAAPTTEATVSTTEAIVPVTEAAAATAPEIQAPEETEADSSTVSARVSDTPFLNVRSGPSTETKVVKKLNSGEEVRVSMTMDLDNTTWAKIEEGWVSAKYLTLDGPVPTLPGEETGTPAVVAFTEELNVRSEPSLSGEKLRLLRRGDVVVITETRGGKWGKISDGWISLDYVILETPKKASSGRPLAGSNGMTAPPETQAAYPDLEQPEIIGPFEDNEPHVHPDCRPENQHPCQHPSWKLYKHFDTTYKEWDEYTCKCGVIEYNQPGIDYHIAIASREEPGMHEVVGHQHFKELADPAFDLWECEVCGVVQRLPSGVKP